MSLAAPTLRTRVQTIGLFAGPALALLFWILLPQEYANPKGEPVVFSAAGRATVCMMVWMAAWWMTEAIAIELTSLLPLAVFPLLGIAKMSDASAPYADENIFLFMGGFILSLSMERWGLGKRIALLTLRLTGSRPANMVGGFMIATGLISAFVSNTATAAMMLPIALSVLALVGREGPRAEGPEGQGAEQNGSDETTVHPSALGPSSLGPSTSNLGLSLMLGIAYAASIGGVATLIGTPPNTYLASFLRKDMPDGFRVELGFARFLLIGLPVVLVFLPATWFLLTRVIYPVGSRAIEGGRELIESQYRALGPPNRGEKITVIVFTCTALLWIGRPWLTKIGWSDGATRIEPLKGVTDAMIAMLAALALCVIPVNWRERQFAMGWPQVARLPWGVLILFGGGLSLAAAVKANGVAEFIGAQASVLRGAPPLLIVLAVSTAVIFLTELTSNTATCAALLPVTAGLAHGLDVHPYLLAFPVALTASMAFMLPVGTPPNAIVFASGRVTIPQMCRAGLWLNVIGIAIVTLVTMTLVKWVMDV